MQQVHSIQCKILHINLILNTVACIAYAKSMGTAPLSKWGAHLKSCVKCLSEVTGKQWKYHHHRLHNIYRTHSLVRIAVGRYECESTHWLLFAPLPQPCSQRSHTPLKEVASSRHSRETSRISSVPLSFPSFLYTHTHIYRNTQTQSSEAELWTVRWIYIVEQKKGQ